MRELSGEQQTEREEYPDVSAGPEPDKGKGWLWHGFAALGISALGLAVAAAVGTRKSSANDRPSRSAAVRAALVEEAAAQRDELLARRHRPSAGCRRPA